MNQSIIEVSKVFEARVRIQMIASLYVSDLTYHQLKMVCQCSDGNMTTHTKKLIEEEFVVIKKEFIKNKPQTTYHLTEHGKEQFINYVNTLNTFLKEMQNEEDLLLHNPSYSLD